MGKRTEKDKINNSLDYLANLLLSSLFRLPLPDAS